jgi:hypothetical protein
MPRAAGHESYELAARDEGGIGTQYLNQIAVTTFRFSLSL